MQGEVDPGRPPPRVEQGRGLSLVEGDGVNGRTRTNLFWHMIFTERAMSARRQERVTLGMGPVPCATPMPAAAVVRFGGKLSCFSNQVQGSHEDPARSWLWGLIRGSVSVGPPGPHTQRFGCVPPPPPPPPLHAPQATPPPSTASPPPQGALPPPTNSPTPVTPENSVGSSCVRCPTQ